MRELTPMSHSSSLLIGFMVIFSASAAWLGCGGSESRSERSYDEIRTLVSDKTADQVLHILGEPDTRRSIFGADERWIWWNYTYLDGKDYPPEIRGHVVHLEIVFKNPARVNKRRHPYSEWHIDDTLGVSYKMPSQGQ